MQIATRSTQLKYGCSCLKKHCFSAVRFGPFKPFSGRADCFCFAGAHGKVVEGQFCVCVHSTLLCGDGQFRASQASSFLRSVRFVPEELGSIQVEARTS